MINVYRVSHVGVRVTDVEKAENFYVNLLGFVETEKGEDYLYLRGIEERQHHSLALMKAPSPGLKYIAFRVSSPEDLDRAEKTIDSMGLPHRKFDERGVKDSIIFQDPSGFPVVLYYEMDQLEDMRLKFSRHRGPSPVRLAHFNLIVKDIKVALKFYSEVLGFKVTEMFYDEKGELQVVWITKRGDSHEVAISQNKRAPGFHHESFYVHDVKDIIRAADVLASEGLWDSIERGPGRHGTTLGLYLYVRDIDKNRFEFFTADYTVLDPDKWNVVKWTWDQRRYRSDFWGRPIPDSWYNEYVKVEDINTGKLVEWGQ
jgi:catechol 2,3-dioxygenase